MIVFDTDTLTLYFRDHPRILQRRQETEVEVVIAVVSRIEVLRGRFATLLTATDGAELQRGQQRLDKAESDLAFFRVLPIDEAAAARFDRLRRNLVYADYLEEHGQAARAEFIRLQCELAKLPQGDRSKEKLVIRGAEIFTEYGDAWLRPLHDLGEELSFEFHRGFVWGLSANASRILETAEEVLRTTPLQHPGPPDFPRPDRQRRGR